MPNQLEERKQFYKMLLAPLPFDMKIDELGDELSDEDLNVLLNQFKEDEEYEICQAFQYEIDRRIAAKS